MMAEYKNNIQKSVILLVTNGLEIMGITQIGIRRRWFLVVHKVNGRAGRMESKQNFQEPRIPLL